MLKRHPIIVVLFLIAGLIVIAGFWFFYGIEDAGKIRYHFRVKEKLLVVLIESNLAYCRTRLCDFRFPLPNDSRVVRIDSIAENEPIKGAVDFVDGTIYVAVTNGGRLDIPAYVERVQNYKPSGNWLNKEIVVGQSVTVETVGQLMAIHFHLIGDSTPLGYY
jgi:hypothetical protein